MEAPPLFPESAAPLASNSRTKNQRVRDTPKLAPPAHHSAPRGTSKVAAGRIAEHAGTQRDCILVLIRSRGPLGLTDDEGEAVLGMKPQSYTPRRGELVQLGQVIDSGQRRVTASNRPAAVWIAREHADPTTPPGKRVTP